jgi:hypothetical protein
MFVVMSESSFFFDGYNYVSPADFHTLLDHHMQQASIVKKRLCSMVVSSCNRLGYPIPAYVSILLDDHIQQASNSGEAVAWLRGPDCDAARKAVEKPPHFII